MCCSVGGLAKRQKYDISVAQYNSVTRVCAGASVADRQHGEQGAKEVWRAGAHFKMRAPWKM